MKYSESERGMKKTLVKSEIEASVILMYRNIFWVTFSIICLDVGSQMDTPKKEMQHPTSQSLHIQVAKYPKNTTNTLKQHDFWQSFLQYS